MLEIDTQDWDDTAQDELAADTILLRISDTDLHLAAMHFAREEEA